MPITMHDTSIAPIVRVLTALKNILAKGKAHATAKGTDELNYLTMRIAPDMLPFAAQVRIACDVAKRGVARLTDGDAPVHDDDEASFDELIARVQSTIDYLNGHKPEQFEGSEDKHIVLNTPMGDFPFKGRDYVFGFMLANVHFHSTMAYALLRGVGVELGKRDYLGA